MLVPELVPWPTSLLPFHACQPPIVELSLPVSVAVAAAVQVVHPGASGGHLVCPISSWSALGCQLCLPIPSLYMW